MNGPSLTGGMGGYSFGGLATENTPITNINAALNLKTIAQLVGIALGLTGVAGAVSVISIMKYEPMRILRERN